jgi:hypothetical protein
VDLSYQSAHMMLLCDMPAPRLADSNASFREEVHMWTAPFCKKESKTRTGSLASICTAFVRDTKAAGQDGFRIAGSNQ